ncbi:MAG TPA: phosphotransferase family protein [Blastocatellia bacterium]|nr:phosphotransferase family protein [Blastocatellia bacterium]
MTQQHISEDTSAVRAGEELDSTALSKCLDERLPDLMAGEPYDKASPIEIEQFPGGHSNLTYMIRAGGHDFVLRRPPFGPVAPTAHDMPREYRLLAAIHPHFPLAPRPYFLCEDPSIIGAPFYLMERRKGLVIRREMPEDIRDNLDLRRKISESMIDTLAALHRVDVVSTGLNNIGKPVGFMTRQVRGWSERWQRAKNVDLDEIDAVVKWLTERLPPDPDPENPPTLVHNDFKLDNVMLDRVDPSKVVAVLDWEMCTVGDPLADMGLLLCYWAEKGDPIARQESISPVTVEPGWLTRARMTELYGKKTGRNLKRIAFYEVFALFKIAVVLQQIYIRYHRGQTHDERFKDFDKRVLGLAQAAAELADRSSL